MVSRVSWGTQQPFRVPQDFFLLGESFHELGHDLVLANELGFELFDLTLLGVLDGLAFAAIVEGGVAVLEELFEPAVDLVGVEAEFIAKVRDGDLVEEMPFEDSDLLGTGEMTTLLVHGEPPYGLC
jgi:hypothetical protein